MAQAKALKPLFDEIVDAIHEKDGESDGISAAEFPARIRAIPSAGYTLVISFDAEFRGESYTVTGPDFWEYGTVTESLEERVAVAKGNATYTVTASNRAGREFSVTVLLGEAYGEYTVKLEAYHIWGVSWDGSAASKLTRTDDAALFSDPVPAVGDGSGSSPFDRVSPWRGMARVQDGENELVAIPKYWLRVQHAPFRVQISDKPLDGFQVSPAHRDREDGQGERDVVYIGRYACDTEYKSRSGYAPKTNTSLNTFRLEIHRLGDAYWQADFALQLTWWYLYLVEYADWDGQSAIGLGVVDASVPVNNGGTDSMRYHTGRAAGENGHVAVQYRNIESPWGNITECRDGIVANGTSIYTYNNPANFSSAYNGAGSTNRSTKTPAKGGTVKSMGYDNGDPSFIFPDAVTETANTYITDYFNYYGAGEHAVYVGYGVGSGTKAGPFATGTSRTAAGAYQDQGSRLMKLPLLREKGG